MGTKSVSKQRPCLIKAILWDNDGVLVDTERLYFRATQVVLASIGIDLTQKHFIDLFLVESRGAWHFALEKGYSADEVERLRQERNDLYNEYLHAEHLVIEGVQEVLARLHGKYKMGIVTSSLKEHFEVIHRSSGLLQYFDFVLASGDYSKHKPDAEPYRIAVRKTGFEPADCIAVEDSLRGLQSAVAAGLRCYIVPTDLTRSSNFKGAYKVLAHVRELVADLGP